MSTQDQGERPFPPAMSLQCPLLTELNIMPAGKGRLVKGSSQIHLHREGLASRTQTHTLTVPGGEGAASDGVSSEHGLPAGVFPPVSEGSSGEGETNGSLSHWPGAECVSSKGLHPTGLPSPKSTRGLERAVFQVLCVHPLAVPGCRLLQPPGWHVQKENKKPNIENTKMKETNNPHPKMGTSHWVMPQVLRALVSFSSLHLSESSDGCSMLSRVYHCN